MKFLDYCFYRIYKSFKKKDDIGLVPAIIYISLTEIMLLIPFVFLIVDILKENDLRNYVKIFVVFFCIIIIIINVVKYAINDRLHKIIIRFEKSKYNQLINSFWFFLLFPLSIVVGFWIYYLIKNY